ncbi:MAG: nucleoside hydrolase [Pseudomonadota bacterium]
MGIWIDTDMGFDDIAAVLVVRHAGMVIDGVSLVAGNVPMDQVRRNAAGACAAFGWSFPVHCGRPFPVLGPVETARRILGQTGMRTVGQALPDMPPVPDGNAFVALCDWLAGDDPEPRRILALGPLGNIAALVLARPDLAAKITDLVWMGGAVGAGNHTASAEFNALADPEALAIILAHGVPLRMVDLDLCRKVPVTLRDAETIRVCGGRNAGLLADLLAGYVMIALERGRPAMGLYDPCAAVAFATADIVHFQPAHIAVELQGSHTRGRTIVDARPTIVPNAQYGVSVDADRARDFVLGALRKEAGQ